MTWLEPADVASGNATLADVLAGKTFSNDSGAGLTGTLTNVGAQNITPNTTDQAISQGYHDGTGKVAGDTDLIAGNIKESVQIFGVTGTAVLASGTAATDEVLSGKTFSNDSGSDLTGTMTNVGTQNFTPTASEQTIHQGYHDGAGKVAGDADLIAGNIKEGVNIFGVAGTAKQASGNATDGQVLAGAAYSNASGSSTGTMPNKGAVTITPGTSNQTIAAGYHNGSGTVYGDGDMVSINIKSGIDIFGVAGASSVVDTSGGDAATGDIRSGKKAYVNGALVTGNITDGSNVIGTDGSLTADIPDGYYTGKTATAQDSDLVAGNIKEGVNIFGVIGTAIQASGNATDGQVLAGAVYSNASGSSTGTMPDNEGDNASTAQSASGGINYFTAPSGFYDGDDRVWATNAEVAALATGLVSGNIKSGVTIFGVSGDSNVVDTSSGDATAENIETGKKAWVDGAEVTGTASSIPAYPAPVPETGQTTHYDTNNPQADDRGTDPPGVSIPNPRFTDNGDGTITDNLTGLIWLKNANCPGVRAWQTALNDVVQLNNYGYMNYIDCGDTGRHTDWRLPTVKEMQSLLDYNYYTPALSNAAGTAQWTSNVIDFSGKACSTSEVFWA